MSWEFSSKLNYATFKDSNVEIFVSDKGGLEYSVTVSVSLDLSPFYEYNALSKKVVLSCLVNPIKAIHLKNACGASLKSATSLVEFFKQHVIQMHGKHTDFINSLHESVAFDTLKNSSYVDIAGQNGQIYVDVDDEKIDLTLVMDLIFDRTKWTFVGNYRETALLIYAEGLKMPFSPEPSSIWGDILRDLQPFLTSKASELLGAITAQLDNAIKTLKGAKVNE
jgi:hypothetical protein